MADDVVLTEQQIQEALKSLPGWEIRDGWLRRKFVTPGWPHTLMLANAGENWASEDEAEKAFDILFRAIKVEAPDRGRLAFYLKLDPLTWG